MIIVVKKQTNKKNCSKIKKKNPFKKIYHISTSVQVARSMAVQPTFVKITFNVYALSHVVISKSIFMRDLWWAGLQFSLSETELL